MELFLSSSPRWLRVGRALFCSQGGWWALQQAALRVDSQSASSTGEQRKQHGYLTRSLQDSKRREGETLILLFPFSVLWSQW